VVESLSIPIRLLICRLQPRCYQFYVSMMAVIDTVFITKRKSRKGASSVVAWCRITFLGVVSMVFFYLSWGVGRTPLVVNTTLA